MSVPRRVTTPGAVASHRKAPVEGPCRATRGVREERSLYEVEFVDDPVPGLGLTTEG
jgi:hypothetical protein